MIWSYFAWDENGHAYPWPDTPNKRRREVRREVNSNRSILGWITRRKS